MLLFLLHSCPSGWTAAADGRFSHAYHEPQMLACDSHVSLIEKLRRCKAGAGYTGPCAAEQSFQGRVQNAVLLILLDSLFLSASFVLCSASS